MRSDKSKIKDLFKNLIFTKDEIEIIASVFHKITLKKGDILLKQGDIDGAQYYILSGCLRAFHLDGQGKDYTIHFGIKDWWISDFTSYSSQEKALMTVEAIQDSVIYKLSKKDKDRLCNSISKIDSFFKTKYERAFAAFQQRILAYLSQTAKERYVDFIQTYPNIEKNVKNYHIASYLGITTESLSRIRKELSNN
ncbi:Crp/Fnr family transcriptional regulator [Winogradskyella flava]|uniref:Crp/Fnr family transcriptional regulator n=1 Tax=Winogradskyella flava TaxID=1884876 RepID=UPI0024923608|nr:Crp/Fnr family transcriptional regulator [Winogradskyella flava]